MACHAIVTSSMVEATNVVGIVRTTVLRQDTGPAAIAYAFLVLRKPITDTSSAEVSAIVVTVVKVVGAEAAHSLHMTCVPPRSRSRS